MRMLSFLFMLVLIAGCESKAEDKSMSYSAIPENLDTAYTTTTAELRSNKLPDSVFEMKHLKLLSVTGMDCDYRVIDKAGKDVTECWGLSEIPAGIKKLKELETLSLNVNAISKIPIELEELKHLRVLILDDNVTLEDLSNVELLENLEVLSVNGCHISSFPKDLSRLKKLRSLGLAGNDLTQAEIERIKKALPGCEIYF